MYVLDGNFSAEQLKMKNPDDDVPISNGHGFMVTAEQYKGHLRVAKEIKEVCGDSNAEHCMADEHTTLGIGRRGHVIDMMPSTRQIYSVNTLSIQVLADVLVADMAVLSLIVWWTFRRVNGICFSEPAIMPGSNLSFQTDEHGLLFE